MQTQTIVIEHLCPHPGNPNRMDDKTFAKLLTHLKKTGRYEPIVVRPLADKEGAYQIINGHHRVRALKQLGYTEVQCVVWNVDDTEARLLLATLNRLHGNDNPARKTELYRQLSQNLRLPELSKLLPQNLKSIERVIAGFANSKQKRTEQAFLIPMTFFLTAEQKEVVEKALKKACGDDTQNNESQRRVTGLVRLAEVYLTQHPTGK